jgi:HEAT repeat protein
VRKNKLFVLLLLLLPLLPWGGCSRGLLQDQEADYVKIIQFQNDSWQERMAALRILSTYRSLEATYLLIKATEDRHPEVQIEALKGLTRNLPPKALERVRHMAEFEENDNVRWYALNTLAQYRDASAALIFAQGLKHRDWLVREGSIKGLLRIDDAAIRYVSVPYIVEALNDRSDSVKIATLQNLPFRDDRIYDAITDLLDESIFYKNTLLKAVLAALRGYRLDGETRKKIINYLTHPNQEIRLMAYQILKKEGD